MKQKNSQLNDQLLFLIACCQIDPSEDDIEFIHTILSDPQFDTKALLSLATQHGILPLVYKTLKKLHIDVQEHFLKELKSTYTQIAQRNMLMSAELIRIMKLFEKNDIEALAFKGPTLAQMAYGDITLRQYSDLDILCSKKDIDTIETLLKAHKYERILPSTPPLEKFGLNYAKDLGLYHLENGTHIELHWSLLDDDFPIQIDLENFWIDTQKITINNQSIPTFENENLLLYLCIHGSKHLWERIEWIKDIDLLIRNEKINWKNLIGKAEKLGFDIMLYFGLALTAQLFNTPLPPQIMKVNSDKKSLEYLQGFTFQNWQYPKNTFQTLAAMLKLFPRIKEKIFYLHKSILAPSLNEYEFIDLPKGFYWVYYFIRPYLLLRKYLTRQVSTEQ